MNVLLKLLGFSLLSLHFSVFSSEFSTKWKIKNHAKERVILTCKLLTNSDVEVAMTTTNIYPSKTLIFDWGDLHYNDGLWLTAGEWKCEAKNKTKVPVNFSMFKTDWGESVTLEIFFSAGKLNLQKK